MKRYHTLFTAVLLVPLATIRAAERPTASPGSKTQTPNIVYILADDLG